MNAVTTILVPLDFSEASHGALRYACRLADRLQASRTLCRRRQLPAAAERPYLRRRG